MEACWNAKFQELGKPQFPVFRPWYRATTTDARYTEFYAKQRFELHFPWRSSIETPMAAKYPTGSWVEKLDLWVQDGSCPMVVAREYEKAVRSAEAAA